MKKNKKLKWVLFAVLFTIIAAGPVFGYWVDKTQADCNIPLKRNVRVLITGLDTEITPEEGEQGIEGEDHPKDEEMDSANAAAVDE